MKYSPNTKQAYDLLHKGSLALGDVEMNGVRIDVDHCRREQRNATIKLKKITEKILSMEEGKYWKKKYGNEFNIGSTSQLGHVLYDHCKYEQTNGKSTGANALASIRTPFTKQIVQYRKIATMKNTFLGNLIRQTGENGIMHPSFLLNTAVTFRSSSMDPNFQNIPIRDPEVGSVIRQAFIPRKGRQLLELDYSGAEVSCGACYHKDPAMISYLTDPTKDMHRDMAMECYKLKKSQVTKKIRYCGKNMFVFPEFYGDYYLTCANSLWKAVSNMNLETADGKSLKIHLQEQELATVAAFRDHIEAVERDFWEKKFSAYTKWKKSLYYSYLSSGVIHTLTGFTIQGSMRRNQVINYPVQGSAFHWLLWSLIQLNSELKRKRMSSMIVGQIHDSMVLDAHSTEVDDVIQLARKIMTKRIRKEYPWIIVPLEADAEVAPIGGSWHEKKDYT